MIIWKAERARELQELHGRTRRWLASQCGVEESSLNKILNSEQPRRPSRAVAMLMAQALQCSLDELYQERLDPKAKSLSKTKR